jgi:hypothetical protein
MTDADEPPPRSAPLDLRANPFTSSAPFPTESAQTLAEVIGHIALKRRAIIIAGRPRSGKTSLLKRIVRSCSQMGLSVREFDRGDLADPTIDARFDVVLVDEADSIPDSAVLTLLSPDPSTTATTWVLMCLRTSVDRFRCLDAEIVQLRGLSIEDARAYLLERATSIGRPDLFAPDALDLMIHQARGSPGQLLSVANMAFFTAGWSRATQIGVRHVADWLKPGASFELAEDRAAPHRSGYELDVYRPIRASTVKGLLLKRMALSRVLRLNGASAALAASIVLAGAVAAFSLGGNDETSVTTPTVADLPATDVTSGQTANATLVGPDIPTSTASDAAEPPSVNAPAANATASLRNPDSDRVKQSRVAPKRTRAPALMKTARDRAPSASSPAVVTRAAQRVQHGVHVARQAQDAARRTAEAALQAQHAARQANDAARRAEQAARRADRAARLAQQAARQASWGIRFRFPWKAMPEPRSAS